MRWDSEIAKLLRDQRCRIGLSQQALGEKLGIPAGGVYVSRYERGECSIPVKRLASVAKVLKLNFKELSKMVREAKIKANFRLGRDTRKVI